MMIVCCRPGLLVTLDLDAYMASGQCRLSLQEQHVTMTSDMIFSLRAGFLVMMDLELCLKIISGIGTLRSLHTTTGALTAHNQVPCGGCAGCILTRGAFITR